ncbi:gag-polypeptide of LTR copia-type domain-containing protein [Phthorimaea operculella]|nr:gag-polypeptide of LTR copia-type domain-containing protein [Phthorimaea operculella]
METQNDSPSAGDHPLAPVQASPGAQPQHPLTMQQIGVPNIEKLEGARNFSSWSFAMKNILIVSDLWDFVESPTAMQEQLGEAQFKRLDAKTKAKICLSVSTSIYPVVTSCPTAQETWKKLQAAYADSGLLRRLHLLRRLFNTRLENCTMEEYVNGIRSTQQQLAEIKAPVDDEFVGVIMLTGLTDKYNPMVMALEGSGTKISSDSVATMLLKEDQRPSASTSTALRTSTSTPAPKPTPVPPRPKLVCSFCKQHGHLVSQCRNRKKTNNKANFSTHVTLYSSCHSSKTPHSSSHWFIDSGATSHMCNDRNSFINLSPQSDTVTVANNQQITSEVPLPESDITPQSIEPQPPLPQLDTSATAEPASPEYLSATSEPDEPVISDGPTEPERRYPARETSSSASKLDPNSKMNELKSLEHATLKVPYEVFNKRYRNAQRVLDVEARQVAGSTAEVDIATRKPPTSIGDFDMMLGGMVEKLTTMKRKATEAINEELQAAFTCKKRLDHLKEQAAALSEPNNPQTRSALSQWRKVRLERMLVDYCLRNGYYDSANKLTEARNLQDLTNVDIYRACAEVERGLALRRTARALQWCADNKSKLRKLNSTMEFNIRIQVSDLEALSVHKQAIECLYRSRTNYNAQRKLSDIYRACAEVERGLALRRTARALQWCADNKSKLRKLNSTMEFNIRIQVSELDARAVTLV